MGTEAGKLLKYQEKQFKITEEKKQLLLGTAEETEQFRSLKKNLGWDDTDAVIHVELNKKLEIANAMKENIDTSILSEDALFKYCLDNNYVVCNVREYKGRIPNKLLQALKEHTEKNDMRLEADVNVGLLYILCPFSELNGNNNNLKKSKRYKKGIQPKIILLEKVLKGNAYSNNHYKIITEQGYNTPIRNFVRGLYSTHSKQRNFLCVMSIFAGIPVLISLINFLVLYFSEPGTNIEFTFCPHIIGLSFVFISSIIYLICRTILPIVGTMDTGPGLNLFDDKGYEVTATHGYKQAFSNNPERFLLTSYLYMKYDYTFKPAMLRLNNQISFYTFILLFSLLSLGIVYGSRCYALSKKSIIASTTSSDSKFNYISKYTSTSPFTYSKTIIKTPKK